MLKIDNIVKILPEHHKSILDAYFESDHHDILMCIDGSFIITEIVAYDKGNPFEFMIKSLKTNFGICVFDNEIRDVTRLYKIKKLLNK